MLTAMMSAYILFVVFVSCCFYIGHSNYQSIYYDVMIMCCNCAVWFVYYYACMDVLSIITFCCNWSCGICGQLLYVLEVLGLVTLV